MDFESYSAALIEEPFDERQVESILDAYYHSGTPYVFRGDASLHGQFKRNIANELSSAYTLRCHPHHVVVCGSAHLGFSPTPTEKFGRSFGFEASDIDVAILLPELFDRWWLELAAPNVELGKHKEDIARDLLNGFINPQYARGFTDTGRKWWALFGGFNANGFNKVRGRIYRDPQFMQNYHRLSIIRGREKLQGARA